MAAAAVFPTGRLLLLLMLMLLLLLLLLPLLPLFNRAKRLQGSTPVACL
jgi:hypothetical protein